MNEKRVLFRGDGNLVAGYGHIMRLLSLACILKESYTCIFIIQQPDAFLRDQIIKIGAGIIELPVTKDFEKEAEHISKQYIHPDDIVVLDGYHFVTVYQQIIKDTGCKLVAIDDLHSWHQVADVVINHANGANRLKYHAEVYTQFYLGLDYVLLRNEFLNTNPPKREITHLRKVFISMGAADYTNITQKFATALLEIADVNEIHLLLGEINPRLEDIQGMVRKHTHRLKSHVNLSAMQIADLLKICDVCICPASTISLESCAIGIVLISGYTAENQVDNLKGMEKSQTLINFGDLNELSEVAFKNKFKAVAANPELLRTTLDHQRKLIDGRSPERITAIFKQLI